MSWLFSGEIEHRDSLGSHAYVRPGELNLMTGGHGIAHSEVSTPDTTILHGVQLWVALPDEHRGTERDFQHHVPHPVALNGGEARVFLGTLAGATSPVRTFTPLLGAELTVSPGARLVLDVDPAFEHGVLVDTGDVLVEDTPVERAALGYTAPGRTALTLTNRGPTRPARSSSAVRLSARRSSCGGTSSDGRMTRSHRLARTGRRDHASARCRGTTGLPCPRRSCRTHP